MPKQKIKLGIVGVGKIVRDQHLPSIEKHGGYEIVATASRNACLDGIAAYTNIEEMLDAVPELEAVALCMPPQYRYAAASLALKKGLHVLLEKPPGATVSEVEQLADLAVKQSVSLYATWHSRHGTAVKKARSYLADKQIKAVNLVWKEDVRKWHPNQQWIWQAGGLGVFDPGINGLSILTHIVPDGLFVLKSELSFPENRAAPIAASLTLSSSNSLPVSIDFDWRQTGDEVWNIEVETERGSLLLSDGGAALAIEGEPVDVGEASPHGHFAEIMAMRQSDVELAPLKLAADAFLLAERKVIGSFLE